MFEINLKSVSGEDRKLSFSVLKENSTLFECFQAVMRGLGDLFIQLSSQELDFPLTPTSEKTTIT